MSCFFNATRRSVFLTRWPTAGSCPLVAEYLTSDQQLEMTFDGSNSRLDRQPQRVESIHKQSIQSRTLSEIPLVSKILQPYI